MAEVEMVVGSSSRSSCGSWARHMAMNVRCRSPPLSSVTGRSARCDTEACSIACRATPDLRALTAETRYVGRAAQQDNLAHGEGRPGHASARGGPRTGRLRGDPFFAGPALEAALRRRGQATRRCITRRRVVFPSRWARSGPRTRRGQRRAITSCRRGGRGSRR